MCNRLDALYILHRHSFAGVDYSHASSVSVPRANTARLREAFDKYASVEKDGKKFMNANDFVRRFVVDNYKII